MLERKQVENIMAKSREVYKKVMDLISEKYDVYYRPFEADLTYDTIFVKYRAVRDYYPICYFIIKENVIDVMVYFEGMTQYKIDPKDVLFFNDLLNSILYNYECTLSFESYDTFEEENEEDIEDEDEDL